jgi:pre-mRNA 3'-end-processing factor FIP1
MDVDEDDDFYAPEEPEAPLAQSTVSNSASRETKTEDPDEGLEEGEEEDEGGEMDEDEDSVSFLVTSAFGICVLTAVYIGHRYHHREERRH